MSTAVRVHDVLQRALHPRVVAIAGVSPRVKPTFNGRRWLDLIQEYGIVERVYAINPRGGALPDGTPLYPSLREVPPDQIDLLICAIPAAGVLALLDEASARHIPALHLVTAGFGETGLAERAALEAELGRRAASAGIRLIGPNCMGLHAPAAGVSWLPEADRRPGRVAMVSQSGANASEVVMRAAPRAVRFSTVVSYGNALDLGECDFLDYLAGDPGTDVVLAYFEGLRDGRRFLPLARRLAQAKPLVVIKGGSTAAGERAVRGHTGSLAGSARVWRAVARQAGLIEAADPDELLDVAVSAQRLTAVAGPRVAVVGRGGGNSVLAADACARAGLSLPGLSAETQERLRAYLPPAGNSLRNPVDSDLAWDSGGYLPVLRTVSADAEIDVVILQVNVDNLPTGTSAEDPAFEEGLRGRLLEAAALVEVPLAVALRPPRTSAGSGVGQRLVRALGEAEIAVYDSVGDCAVALRRYLDWRDGRRDRL